MLQVNIHAAKTQLSALVEQVAQGQSFVIARAGKPLATVQPYQQTARRPKRLGFLKGAMRLPSAFDIDNVMTDEMVRMFAGKYGRGL